MRIPWRASAWALVLLGVGCSPELPSDLGEHPEDRVRLVDSPGLVHLAAALDDGDSLTVEDLFRQEPTYVRSPNPAELLADMRRVHRNLPAQGPAERLRVLSFNTGLLDRWYPFVTLQVPFVDDRRERMPSTLLADGWDVLLLQEVWENPDVDAFVAEAEQRGYLSYGGSEDAHEDHGLLVLVREELVDPDGPDERREHVFERQRDVEDFPGPAIVRGFLSWRFRHAPTGVVIDLVDTHTTPFTNLASIRDAQARRLGLFVRDLPDDEVVVLGGDLNAGPYYPLDVFAEEYGEPVTDWWHNAQAYGLLLHYGGLYDVHAAAGEASDVEVMDQLLPYGPDYHDVPLGDPTLCDELAGVFTAGDCNSLYYRQYGATGYPARIDFLMVRDTAGAVRVDTSEIAYDGVTSEGYELSDHYGVGARLFVAPP